MDTNIPLYEFQRSSPFFPMVLNYTVLLLAIKEFGAAGIALHLKSLPDAEYQKELAEAKIQGNVELVERLKSASVEELYPPLVLVSEFQDQHINIDAFATMRELGTNIGYLVDDLKLSAVSALLVQAYEATKKSTLRSHYGSFYTTVGMLGRMVDGLPSKMVSRSIL